jgi:uncharacterized protein
MNLEAWLPLLVLGALAMACAPALALPSSPASALTPAPSDHPAPTAVDVFAAIAAGDAVRLEGLLAAHPALAGASTPDGRSAVLAALFTLDAGGEDFVRAEDNGLLRAVAAHRPPLDAFDAAAVGDAARLGALLDEDATRAGAFHPALGTTPLHLAAFAGRVETVELLLHRGAAVDAIARNRFRNTPLVLAVLGGQESTARALLARGADPRVPEKGGLTALHLAAAEGSVALVSLLLDRGADAHAKADDGSTPAMLATKRGHGDVAALLERRSGG